MQCLTVAKQNNGKLQNNGKDDIILSRATFKFHFMGKMDQFFRLNQALSNEFPNEVSFRSL
jgi:hypothetical protein